jgi:hypothetical protein
MKPGSLRTFVYSWVELASALIGILSLGRWYPSWGFNFLSWVEVRYLRALRDKNKDLTDED